MGGKLLNAYGKIKVTIRKYIATLLTVVAQVMRTGILKQHECEGGKKLANLGSPWHSVCCV